MEFNIKKTFDKYSAPFHHDRCIEWHSDKDYGCNKELNCLRIIVRTQKLGKGARLILLPQLARATPKEDKSNNHPHKHIQQTEPLNTHTKCCCHTTKTNNGRGGDKRSTIRERHYNRVHLPTT